MRCLIVCGGDFSPTLFLKKDTGDLLIAADSGLQHLRALGILPDVAIGDWDSLGETPEGMETVTLTVRKDDTDLVAACRLGYERGCRDFLIFGALGGTRFSHSLAAVQTLHWLKTLGASAEIWDEHCRICCIAAGEALDFSEHEVGHISLFSLTEQSSVDLSGLWYSGENIALEAAFPLGVSNAFVGEKSHIDCRSGIVAIILDQ